MQEQLEGAAWSLGLWGAISIIFGVLVLAWPGITLKAFLLVLGIYLVAAGVVLVLGSIFRHTGHWILGIVIGALSTVAGLYVFANPTLSALAVLTVIAIWAIAAGALEIVAGFEAKEHGVWLILSGAILVLFGFYIFARPGAGALVLVWLIGLSMVFSGIMSAVAATRLGKLDKRVSKA